MSLAHPGATKKKPEPSPARDFSFLIAAHSLSESDRGHFGFEFTSAQAARQYNGHAPLLPLWPCACPAWDGPEVHWKLQHQILDKILVLSKIKA
jgi:hypothetical protein